MLTTDWDRKAISSSSTYCAKDILRACPLTFYACQMPDNHSNFLKGYEKILSNASECLFS